MQSSNNTLRIEQFGQTGDDPSVVADYDGDGRIDLAVYRFGVSTRTQNYFYYRPSATPGVSFRAQPWGAARYDVITNGYIGDYPYPGDYDGDGKGDFIVNRADYTAPATFFILKSNGEAETVYFGLGLDKLVPGDYDGDGKTDICVRRGNVFEAQKYFIRFANGATQSYVFGSVIDLEVPGDYDGDGRTDIAVYNYQSGMWSVLPMSGAPPFYFSWGRGIINGLPTDVPPAFYIVQHPQRGVT